MFNSAAVFDTSEGTSKRFSVPVVQELASQHLHSLPERYIRSEKERPNDFSLQQTDIPIIDMDMFLSDSEFCRQKELEKLGTACQQWGFFQAVNHGIPVSMMERMKKIVREFVQLPLEEKLKYEMQEAEGYGQLFVASDNQVLDWSDIVFLTTLPTENRKMNFWPTTPADFRETVDRYALEIQKLCKTIFCLLSEKIGLKRDTFINMCGEMEQAIRMNYYPACPRPDLVLGISPHADGSALTALLQDDETVGLQIRKDGQWFSIQPIPGALVINVGDVLEAVNHGIPLSLMQGMKGIVKEFVQLPLEEKLKYEMKEIEGYGQTFVASDDQILDWTDTLFLTTLPPENRNMNFWPTKPADFRETVDQYAVEIQKLGKTILSLLSDKVELKTDRLINMCGKTGQTMRMNYYPPCPRPDLVLGLSPHSDASGLTLLLQDDETVGLHICKDGKWIPIQPIPGALVINIGDMIEVISNGIYKSIEHRVVTNRDRDRISIAMFYSPSGECEVGPAPELIDELHPCQYRTFIRKDYMRQYFSSKLDGKASIEFTKIK